MKNGWFKYLVPAIVILSAIGVLAKNYFTIGANASEIAILRPKVQNIEVQLSKIDGKLDIIINGMTK